MAGTKKVAPASSSAIKDSDMDFHAGEQSGSDREAARIKKLMDDRYKELVNAFNKEVNIATRYELKLRLDELTTTYELLFKGE